jgi:hypothetical protein
MNLYLTAAIARRFLGAGLAIGAVFFGHHVLDNAQQESVNHSVENAQKNGDFSVSGGGTKVTVKGLPAAGQ